jgi:hypothetical protein
MKPLLVFLSLVLFGFLLASASAAASGEREAWDASTFWMVTLPGLILAAGVAGYVDPRYFAAWGIAAVAGLALQILSGSGIGSLWFVGLLFCLMLAVACGAGAAAGAALRRRHSRRGGPVGRPDERSTS